MNMLFVDEYSTYPSPHGFPMQNGGQHLVGAGLLGGVRGILQCTTYIKRIGKQSCIGNCSAIDIAGTEGHYAF